jgi:hypothetical protein
VRRQQKLQKRKANHHFYVHVQAEARFNGNYKKPDRRFTGGLLSSRQR